MPNPVPPTTPPPFSPVFAQDMHAVCDLVLHVAMHCQGMLAMLPGEEQDR